MLIAARNAMMTKSLPYDAEVEYLESTGTQWIDTGVSPDGSTEFELKMSRTQTSYNYNVYGSRDVLNGPPAFGLISHGPFFIPIHNSWTIERFGSSWNTSFARESGIHIYAIKNNMAYYDGQAIGSNFRNISISSHIVMFGYNSNGNVEADIIPQKIYYNAIWKNSLLVRDFIPVRFTNEQSQTEGAMYDRVSGELFRNQGTGAFVIGPDIAAPTI